MTDDPKDRAIAVAELRERIEVNEQRKTLTVAQRKLLDQSAVIFGEPATRQDAAYLPRELVQVTLPHKNPGNIPVWRRTNGNLTVGIQPGTDLTTGQSCGYPYGTIPRLLLFWVTTEAVQKKSRRLELGNSLRGFMAELGLNSSNGSSGAKRSDARRLRDQMQRLFQARVSFQGTTERNGRHGEVRLNMQVADTTEFWWSHKEPEQAALWGSWIELGEKFFDAITAYPVPADMRALRALKCSALALDLYAWLSYEAFRAHRSGKPRFENWMQLHDHLGAEYARPADFRRYAKAALRKIKVVYPSLKLGDRQGGIEVLPESWPAIQPRDMTIGGLFRTR
ncbi:MAG: plasmid encoded RepA protein [Acidobacteria bacterium]|nr:plasmid encoded RepA protein [Acidobacteriota bacterium]